MYQYLNPYFGVRIASLAILGVAAFKLYSPPYDRVYWNCNVKRLWTHVINKRNIALRSCILLIFDNIFEDNKGIK